MGTENRKASRIPRVVSIVLLLVQLALTYRAVLARLGLYSYPVDDAFIQLSIARHVAFDGVYGVTRHAFAAASSSLVWPFLLAAVDKVAGNHLLTPLVLNCFLAVGFLFFFDDRLGRMSPDATIAWRLFWLVALVLLVPLSTLVLTGMEHVLQALATLWLVLEGAEAVTSEGSLRSRQVVRVALAAALTCAARYEGLFVVAIVAALALARRRWSLAGAVVAAGAAPVVIFGVYSKAHGGLFLPNSVLLKGRSLAFRDMTDVGDFLFGDLVHRLSINPHVLVLACAVLFLWLCAWRREGFWSFRCCVLAVAAVTTLAHVQMAGLGWFFRYEAYLVALDIGVVALTLTGWFPSPLEMLAGMRPRPVAAAAAALSAVIVLGPLLKRALDAIKSTPTACENIYEQQVQSARFLARYFGNDTVAVNDIGAVTYYGDEPIVDVMGIATTDAARAKSFKLHEPMSRADFARITRPASVAIVYDEWVGSTPSRWLRVGRWRIDDNQVCAFSTVAIYATSPDEVPRVIEALRSFSGQLPARVHQEGRYTQPEARDDPYRLDAGDVLYAHFEGAPELGGTVQVQADGSLEFPKMGAVAVRGMSLREATDQIRVRLATAASSNPAPVGGIDLRLLEERAVRTYAVGDVQRSGEFSTTTAPTADFLLRVSGAEATGQKELFFLRERGGQFRRVSVDAARAEGLLEPGDILVVR